VNRVDIQQSLNEAKHVLSPITDQPVLEAEILLAYVLGKSRAFLYAWPKCLLSDDQIKLFNIYLQRRCRREPVAYITGTKEFWSLSMAMSQDTLIPRPETEMLVEAVLTCYPNDHASKKIADLGTGSGAIGLALAKEKPVWNIYATDISHAALERAKKNASQLTIENINFFQGNWCTALPRNDFDIIVSNPPYIAEAEWDLYAENLAFEPKNALVSGEDGLDAIRQISQSAKYYLKPGGYLLVEHGYLQADMVRELFAVYGYSHIDSICDLAGHERITLAQYLPK